MEIESRTGKIFVSGKDKWGRPVIIFNNECQNTNDVDDQMTFLAFNLELAIKEMGDAVDKYVIFMHLYDFSLLSSPPMRSTKETIEMLTKCFPERLGHCILYQVRKKER